MLPNAKYYLEKLQKKTTNKQVAQRVINNEDNKSYN